MTPSTEQLHKKRLEDFDAVSEKLKHLRAIDGKALAQYEGMVVAFSKDCTKVIAAAEDLQALNDQIVAVGEDPGECLISEID